LLLELFVVANLAFLAVDILLAHSVNEFARWEEWIPFACSVGAAPAILAALVISGWAPAAGAARGTGIAVGGVSVAVGGLGLVLHLDSGFFQERTLRSLVYAAPFAAPLAYSGLGLLLLLNRTEADGREWSRWVLLLAAGGFAGNFALSLADHAQNGFFRWTEWFPVVVAAYAAAFLATAAFARASTVLARTCRAVLGIAMLVGVWGFALHAAADLAGPAASPRDNFVFGAPVFAPLLFPNLGLLGFLGLNAAA
jgi:hypothetical protein